VGSSFYVIGVGAQSRFDAEAVRLNNRGVALMGQQFTERAWTHLPRHSKRIRSCAGGD